jgi:hypothetical protein
VEKIRGEYHVLITVIILISGQQKLPKLNLMTAALNEHDISPKGRVISAVRQFC